MIKALLFALALTPTASAQTKAVMEGVPSTRYAIKVDTTQGRVEIGTTSYSGGIANVGLYVTSNVVVGTSANRNACVIYATGTINCLGVNLSSSALQSSLLASTQTWTGTNTFSGMVNISSAITGPTAVIVATYAVTGADVSVGTFNGVCYGTATIVLATTSRILLSFYGAGHNATSTDKLKVSIECDGSICNPYGTFSGDARGMGSVPTSSDAGLTIPSFMPTGTFAAGTHRFCWTAWRTSGSASTVLCGATTGDPPCMLHVTAFGAL